VCVIDLDLSRQQLILKSLALAKRVATHLVCQIDPGVQLQVSATVFTITMLPYQFACYASRRMRCWRGQYRRRWLRSGRGEDGG
jgi:hypothetical protein